MNLILACRLEESPANNLELDALLLEWLADMPAVDHREFWLRHSYGLVGDMTGTLRLLGDLCPHATWSLAFGRRADGAPYSATIVPAGGGRILMGEGQHPANAMLAAIARAFDAGRAANANSNRQTRTS